MNQRHVRNNPLFICEYLEFSSIFKLIFYAKESNMEYGDFLQCVQEYAKKKQAEEVL